MKSYIITFLSTYWLDSLLTAYAQLGRKITKDLRIMNSAVKGFKDMEKEILETEAEAAEQLKEAKEDM